MYSVSSWDDKFYNHTNEGAEDFKNTSVQLIEGDLQKREDLIRAMEGIEILAMHIDENTVAFKAA